MKINSKDFRVRSGKNFDLREWPTTVKPFYKSKRQYQELLEKHVEELSSPKARRTEAQDRKKPRTARTTATKARKAA